MSSIFIVLHNHYPVHSKPTQELVFNFHHGVHLGTSSQELNHQKFNQQTQATRASKLIKKLMINIFIFASSSSEAFKMLLKLASEYTPTTSLLFFPSYHCFPNWLGLHVNEINHCSIWRDLMGFKNIFVYRLCLGLRVFVFCYIQVFSSSFIDECQNWYWSFRLSSLEWLLIYSALENEFIRLRKAPLSGNRLKFKFPHLSSFWTPVREYAFVDKKLLNNVGMINSNCLM